ncbi:MAG TPA: choice-of-anchor D domain-containing protein [Terriglobia bacterium]|nr:choice-of-anchor D domain-containing protein [Terriglobia bacterium]
MRPSTSRNHTPAAIAVLSALMIPTAWAQNHAVPHVDQPLVPASAAPGSPFTLTVHGTGFASGSTIDWNGSPLTNTTYLSATTLQALVTADDVAGTASVTVVNATPGGGVSNVVFFQVVKAATQVSLTSSNLVVGSGPAGVFTADFNNDKRQDLAVTNESSNSVSILLGSGGGNFNPHVDYATGLGPQDVADGDFNDDGKLDLATVNAGENTSGDPVNTVSILLGNGDGTFQPHVDYATGGLPVDLVTGDFNGDGFLDLATVNEDGQSVSILLGKGDGTFQAHVDYDVGALPMGLVAADFNGDGTLDFAVVNYQSQNISILLGNGDGTFQPAVDYAAPTNPVAIVAADFNGDGHQDLAVAALTSGSVAVLLGNGDGTFGAYVNYPTGSYPESVVTGDFNGDGKLDLALATDNGLGGVSLLLGNGDGSFQSVVNFPSGLLPVGISTGDFNGDGMLDLAAADIEGDTASAMLQTTVLFAPTNLTFASQALGTTSPAQTVTVTNMGSTTLTISSVSTAAPFAETNTCGTSLVPGASCTASVTFSPTIPGTANGSLSLSDGAVGSPQVVSLAGSGSGPFVSLSPNNLNFGNVQVGQKSSSQTVTLTNTGNSTLTITSVTPSGNYNLSNHCGSTLAPATSCNLDVTFSPTASGTANGTLSLVDNAIGTPQAATLTGVGIQGLPIFSPTSLAFSTQLINTTSPAQTVTLTNTGSASLTITRMNATGPFAQTNTCGSSVAVGAKCTITVTFTPTSGGTPTGSVTVSDNGPASPQTVSLTGTATILSVSPLALGWGTVNLGTSGSPQVVTLINKGTYSVGSLSASITGTDPSDFSDTTACEMSLSPAASCTYSVTFTPSVSGARTASLSISYASNAGGSPQTVALSGTGGKAGSPAVTFTPGSLGFGNVNVGSSSGLGLTLTNTGGSNLTVTSVTGSGDYTETNTCSASLPPGQTCSISVTFKPIVMGADNGTLTVTDNAGNSPQSVSLTGTGLQPEASLSPASLTFATQLVNTTSPAQTVKLTNTGNATLTVTRISVSNSSYAETNTCGSSVNAGASCTISVTFTPANPGTPTGAITLTDNAPTNPQTVNLTGTGTNLSVSPLSLSWGTVKVGQSGSAKVVTLTNKGTFSVGSLSASITGADPADFSDTTTCTQSLAVGASCTYSVTFKPTATGSRTASLSISYGSSVGGSPQAVSLSGTGD